MKKGFVRFAENLLQRINMLKQDTVRQSAQDGANAIELCEIIGIRKVGKADVFNMEVEHHHNFSVAGGFILHNCDALRYFCKTIVHPRRL